MTREEAIMELNRFSGTTRLKLSANFWTALEMAIKALEQEPCEDSISRAEVIDELNRLGRNAFKDDTDYDNFFAFIDTLPPVTPTRKKGKWKTDGYGHIVCTACNDVNVDIWKSRFCPMCGAEMESEE